MKIGQLEEIRTTNKNDPDRCMYALLKELVGIKGGSPYKKLCKALESDIISEKALAEGLKSKYGSTNIRITLKGGYQRIFVLRKFHYSSSVLEHHRSFAPSTVSCCNNFSC